MTAFVVWVISAFAGSGITLYDFSQNAFYAGLVGSVGLAIEKAIHINRPGDLVRDDAELRAIREEFRTAEYERINAARRRAERPW